MNNEGSDGGLQAGEIVIVRDGPCAGFRGTVLEMRRQVLHLEVSVFGLPTRIEVALASVDREAADSP